MSDLFEGGQGVNISATVQHGSGTRRVASPTPRNWVVVASEDHVQAAVRGGFIQAGHGKRSAVAQFAPGDTIVCYSSKRRYGDHALCQCFTALGTVVDAEPFEVQMNDRFAPFRRRVEWRAVESAPIQPLLDELSFIRDRKSWGYMFRLGVFRIPDDDARRIEQAMHADRKPGT